MQWKISNSNQARFDLEGHIRRMEQITITKKQKQITKNITCIIY